MAQAQTDWAALWSELSLRMRRQAAGDGGPPDLPWERASRSSAGAGSSLREEPDLLMLSFAEKLRSTDAVVDIGAGKGRWALYMARLVRRVTAIDASPAMLDILRANIAVAGAANIAVLPGDWESIEVEPHDVALCSHALYASPDFAGYVRKMERAARRLCVLVLRAPSYDGVIGQLSRRIHGGWHDSPNFVIAHNLLREMGIHPDVLMEPTVRPWTDATFDEAVARAKRHLRLGGSTAHDEAIREALRSGLELRDGRYLWPDGMRSALVWWETGGG